MKTAPIARKENAQDPYGWLRDKSWPKVNDAEILAYLNEENDYLEEMTKSQKDLEKSIYEELKARIKEDDESYPIKKDNFYYFTRIIKDKDYPVLCRRSKEGEQILLDGNELAKGKPSFALGATKTSKDHSKLVYAFDSDGSEKYIIKVKDLKLFVDLEDIITGTIGDIVWNHDNTGFYYLKLNENWRPDRVFFHFLGTRQEEDILIYQEEDHKFYINLESSCSEEFLFINTGNGTNNEVLYLSLKDKHAKPIVAIARKEKHLYSLDHMHNKFYILTNDHGKNFRLATFVNNQVDEEIIPHSEENYLVDMALYNDYLIVNKRVLGLNIFECYDLKNYKCIDKLDFKEQPYQASMIFTNKEDKFLRISYSSLVTPRSIFEYEFSTCILHLRKTEEVKYYDANLYETKRIWAQSIDGVKIPISIVYKKELFKENMPCLLYGYGSYGSGMPATFRPNIISLLDRGFIYAIAHIRGGDELGFKWYEDAKFLTKKLTFEDFIASARYLISQSYTSREKLAIMGGSAGGMLIGVVVNQAPELFKAAVALVPFVDVLNTMLDDSLPLTPIEFEEWGNPKNPEYFEYIKSYSPYDNVKEQNYPSMLITTGLTDPRVGYWEAAKWVAKLRDTKLDNNLLLLKTEMEAGHGGKSGRFRILEEVAMIYSFIIKAIL